MQILKKARTAYKASKAAHVLMGNDSPRGTPIIVKVNHPAGKDSHYKNDWSFPVEKRQIVRPVFCQQAVDRKRKTELGLGLLHIARSYTKAWNSEPIQTLQLHLQVIFYSSD